MPNAEQVIEQIKQIDDNQELNKIKEFVESIDNNLKEIILSELSDKTFKIPYYQRGYRWTENNINTLLDDFKEFLDDKSEGNTRYILQPLAITKTENKNEFEVIDGQQRLTTLYLIHKYLVKNLKKTNSSWYSFNYDFEKSNDNENDKMSSVLESIQENHVITDSDNINIFYVKKAYSIIEKWFEDHEDYKNKIFSLMTESDDTNKVITFLWYEVDSNLRHTTFQNINSGKIQLTNSDLIKALLLSETTGLPNREQIAAQYELMERQFNIDRFWFMFNKKDINKPKGQSRIDFLFNIYENVNGKESKCLATVKEYQNDSRTAFYKIMKLYHKDKSVLNKIWTSVRKNFQILLEFSIDPECYHYIAFLRYHYDDKDFYKVIVDLLSSYTSYIKTDITERNVINFNDDNQDFITSKLKKKIAKNYEDISLEDINYDNNNQQVLREIFILHNIQTILCKYKLLKENRALQYSYEYFPFELLYKQNWQIEHIASKRTNDLNNPESRKKVLESYIEVCKKLNITLNFSKNNQEYDLSTIDEHPEYIKDDNTFNKIWECIIDNSSIDNDAYPMEYTKADVKNSLMNLVLLDNATNEGYHNDMFSVKRKKIIEVSSSSKNEVRFVPICTKNVFTKSYSETLKDDNFWTIADAKAYLKDITEKIGCFFKVEGEN